MKRILKHIFTASLLSFLVCAQNLYAQVCSGSLGDPVVNITFGSGSGGGAALPTNNTNYAYTSSCPSDGRYSVMNSIPNCYSTWHRLAEDHTPDDANGYMMVVNASNSPGIFYQETVSGLCPNTTYEFAAWVINLINNRNYIKPNITFTIQTPGGVTLATYDTGDIPEISPATWRQSGFLFNTPTGISDVVLIMQNNAPGGTGNDLALDDITFRPCGPDVNALISVRGSNTNILCEDQPGIVDLDALISSGYNSPAYQWQVNLNDNAGWKDIPGATTVSYALDVPSANIKGYQYRFSIADANNGTIASCRIYSDALAISVIPRVTANAGPDKTILQGTPVQLEGKATGTNQTYLWTPSAYLDDPTSLNPIASPVDNITYTLNVTSTDGCQSTASDEMLVRVYVNLVVPNTFTPNGDGTNDTWEIVGLNTYPGVKVSVYNRYGEVVFRSTGYPQAWNGSHKGKSVPLGSYSYVIDLNDGSPKLSGWLLVLR